MARKNSNPKVPVLVLVDALPKGLSVNSGAVSVESGYQHQILGRFAVVVGSRAPFWFIPYEKTWRKALCYWQVPLTWITLGLWAAVPTSYPCWGRSWLAIDKAVQKAKAIAASAGANLVVGTFSVRRGNRVRSFVGLVIRADPRFNTQPGQRLPTQKKKLPKARDWF